MHHQEAGLSLATTKDSSTAYAPMGWRISLWAAQVILAVLFGLAGVLKTTMAPAELPPMGIAWATDVPVALLRFIGAAELLGAIGVVLPALTRILPLLTPAAAVGFATIQVLAIGFHAIRGETGATLPLNIALLALSLFVIWGRIRKAPIEPRA
jgi:DoxX-like family